MQLTQWFFCAQAPSAVEHPDELATARPEWLPAPAPGTVAGALRDNGRWDLGQPLDADAWDWWYRTEFATPEGLCGGPCFLCFDGLATDAEAWLNGEPILQARNMFRVYRVDVSHRLRGSNQLAIAFRSLTETLKQKRPRGRWKTSLVQHQQLRWQRTSLLGRIPGWSTPVAPVGPWRAIRLEAGPICVADLRLTSTYEDGFGTVTLQARVNAASRIDHARLHVGREETAVAVVPDTQGWCLRGQARIANPPLWWPHTHGEQPLLETTLKISVGGRVQQFSCGKIGFRQVEVLPDDRFGLCVNGVPVYCRGACWTVQNVATLDGTEEGLARDLRLARQSGANMLRVPGPTVYESDAFYRLCDELGILVWQDLPFANMDYPLDDGEFVANVEAEVTYQLGRLARHPSAAVVCGNSEVEQQAAMLGMPRECWRHPWFAERAPALCREYHPGAVYVPSSPGGGVLPFHIGTGVAHYYGVGAYLRSPAELRQADVKFASECLGFANIPEPETLDALGLGSAPPVHHPRWKERVPRDSGAGWDFDDVRDFYLRQLFGVDPVALRSTDTERYLQLGRVVTGEMMAQVFAEWRSTHSHNRGGLVWFYKDLWPGAGWGIIDSLGRPKAAYYFLRRAWQTRQITLTDEGLDGLHAHAINETAEPLDARVEILLLRDGQTVVARQCVPCRLAPQSARALSVDAILQGFYDVNFAYRFGPAKHDVVVATLLDAEGRAVSEAFHFIHRREPTTVAPGSLQAEAICISADRHRVRICSDCFLHAVRLEAKGFLPDDNYFHLVPGREKVVDFVALDESPGPLKAGLTALNLRDSLRIPVRDAVTGGSTSVARVGQ